MRSALALLAPLAVPAAFAFDLMTWFPNDEPLRIVAHFETEGGDGVVAWRTGDLDRYEARKVLDATPVVPGRAIVAVLYEDGTTVPDPALDEAADLPTALALVSSPPYDGWSYRLQVGAEGKRAYD